MARSLLQGRSIGMVLLSIYLILAGLGLVIGLSFEGLPILMGVLALLAGVAILAGR
jgi:hypothetical protein